MMSIALESNTSNRIDRSGFSHGISCMGIYNSPEIGRFTGDRRFSEGEREDDGDSCSSSSIGRNSDSSDGGDGDSGDGEVQSSFNGPLNSVNGLEEVLPIKRGISTFYSGKSKSFTSLADAACCSSIKDIVKPEDAYTRKRKNILAHSILWDKNRNFTSISGSGGISKRLNSSRSTLTMKRYEGNNSSESSNPNSASSSPRLSLPPLPPNSRRSPNNESPETPPRHNFSPWRSFSLSDLQHAAAAAAATPTVTGSVIDEREKDDDMH